MSSDTSRLRGPGVRLVSMAMAVIAFVLEKVLIRAGASETPHRGPDRAS